MDDYRLHKSIYAVVSCFTKYPVMTTAFSFAVIFNVNYNA